MNKHKTKLFKKVFQDNADCTTNFKKEISKDIIVAGFKEAITEEVFVPLMGAMWSKAKSRYKKRYKQKAFLFVEWLHESKYTRNLHNSKIFWYKESDLPNANFKTTEELFEIWKKEN